MLKDIFVSALDVVTCTKKITEHLQNVFSRCFRTHAK